MKIGTQVAVCHDGKWGRRVEGVVIGTRRGHHIKVKFLSRDGQHQEFWARVIPTTHKWSNYKHFGGWVNTDDWCPWYAVYKWKKG